MRVKFLHAAAIVCFACLYAATARAAEPWRMTLDAKEVGKLPAGWSEARTGEGAGSVWRVVADKTTPGGLTLAQTSDAGPDPMFNLCVAETTSFTDVELNVQFKAIAGKLDQGGGVVWRYQNAKNYYIARMNPLEDNYRVYKVVDGKRTQLATADVKAPAGEWHKLRVKKTGDHIECYLDGKLLLDVKDATFTKPGKIGLWTKADAQTRFAGLEVSGK
jgi:hypothetical protein